MVLPPANPDHMTRDPMEAFIRTRLVRAVNLERSFLGSSPADVQRRVEIDAYISDLRAGYRIWNIG